MTIIDDAITALARHYDIPEPEYTEDLYVTEAETEDLADRYVGLLECVTRSLIAALSVLNDWGFDDAAVTAAEEIDQIE